MKYQIEFKPKAEKDLKSISLVCQSQIIERIRLLEDNLRGDVKRLTNMVPEYRMRSGDYRILFEIIKDRIIIYRILHRRESYR